MKSDLTPSRNKTVVSLLWAYESDVFSGWLPQEVKDILSEIQIISVKNQSVKIVRFHFGNLLNDVM